MKKKRMTAWLVKTDGFDSVGIVACRTERGAKGYTLRAIRDAFDAGPLDLLDGMEVEPVYALDEWAKQTEVGRCMSIQVVVREAIDIAKRPPARKPEGPSGGLDEHAGMGYGVIGG